MQDVARFEVRQGDDPGVVASGELDVATVPELKDALTDLIDRNPGTSVWVDMAGVSFIDSSGLGVLVGGAQSVGRASQGLRDHRAPGDLRRRVRSPGPSLRSRRSLRAVNRARGR